MRIVVFSDSHQDYYALVHVVEQQPEAALFIHLGDGQREFDKLGSRFPEKRMLGVCGNCDWGMAAKLSDITICQNKTIFFTHGHTFNVKAGTEALEQHARTVGADIALYGHSHTAATTYRDGLYMINPGSISLPRDGAPSYAVIDITGAGIVPVIVRI